MKKIGYICVATLILLGLAGCNTTMAPGTGPISSGTSTAAKIITGTQQVCQYAPTATTITKILAAAGPAATASTIIQAICAAVAPLASGPGSSTTPGYAFGVKVHGRSTIR